LFGVIRSFHIRHQFEANCEWQTSENEVIAMAIPTHIGSSKADEPNGRANARPLRIVCVIRCATGPWVTPGFCRRGRPRRQPVGADRVMRSPHTERPARGMGGKQMELQSKIGVPGLIQLYDLHGYSRAAERLPIRKP
jgi:hypothetical protein